MPPFGQVAPSYRSKNVLTHRRYDGQPSNGHTAMPPESQEPITGKARKRSAAKPSSRGAASKIKATIHLSIEASQRLTVHAAMVGMDRSELVESLIQQHLKRFVVSDRGGAEGGNGGIQERLHSCMEPQKIGRIPPFLNSEMATSIGLHTIVSCG